MKRTALLLIVSCGFITVLLWRSFRTEPPDIVAPAQAETTGPLKANRATEDFTTAGRKHVVASRPVAVVRTPAVEYRADDDVEVEQQIRLERSTPTPYPGESEGAFKFRIRLLDAFDAFVEDADLTGEEIAAVQVAVYDAQSGFGEISRRVYRRPQRPNWVAEAGDDAERLRRELFSNVASIVGKDRARLLPTTFGTGLEVVSHRLFLKPGQQAIDL